MITRERAERRKLLVNKQADHELDDAGLDAQHATAESKKRIRKSSVFSQLKRQIIWPVFSGNLSFRFSQERELNERTERAD